MIRYMEDSLEAYHMDLAGECTKEEELEEKLKKAEERVKELEAELESVPRPATWTTTTTGTMAQPTTTVTTSTTWLTHPAHPHLVPLRHIHRTKPLSLSLPLPPPLLPPLFLPFPPRHFHP